MVGRPAARALTTVIDCVVQAQAQLAKTLLHRAHDIVERTAEDEDTADAAELRAAVALLDSQAPPAAADAAPEDVSPRSAVPPSPLASSGASARSKASTIAKLRRTVKEVRLCEGGARDRPLPLGRVVGLGMLWCTTAGGTVGNGSGNSPTAARVSTSTRGSEPV